MREERLMRLVREALSALTPSSLMLLSLLMGEGS